MPQAAPLTRGEFASELFVLRWKKQIKCGILMYMKAKRNEVSKKKRKNGSKPVIAFLITLALVLGMGLFGIQIYLWVSEDGKKEIQEAAMGNAEEPVEESEKASLEKKPLFELPVKEKIPQKESEEISEAVVLKRKGRYADILADAELMAKNNIYEASVNDEGIVTIGFAGDILFDDEYAMMAKLLQRGVTIENALSEELLGVMRGMDIMMVNNEFPFTNRGIATEGKTYTFRADADTVSYLHDMGVDIVSLANNHAYDFGEEGLLDTFDTLEGAKIPYVGAGRNIEEATKPVYFIAGDVKIAIVSATQIERLENPDTKEATANTAGVFRCLDPKRLLETVAEAEENSDFVIVFIHWGTENVAEPDWAQLDQAPRLAEAGADLIVGAHPHCLQGFEYYGDVPVVYSMGNFWFNSKTLDTCVLQADISKDGLEGLRFIPAIQEDCRTRLAYGEEKARIISYMESISYDVAIDEAGYISKKIPEN